MTTPEQEPMQGFSLQIYADGWLAVIIVTCAVIGACLIAKETVAIIAEYIIQHA